MTTLIRGGTVVTAENATRADVLVEEGVISAIGRLGSVAGADIIDATDRLILPGGVDPHVHFETPSAGVVTADTFTTGSIAAAHGGTTTALHFCVQDRGEGFQATIERWHRKLERNPPVIDVGFHLMLTDWEGGGGQEVLAALPGLGVTSFKVFMAGEPMVSGGVLLRTLQTAAASGALVMVHAEDGEVINELIRDALAAGRTHPREHARTRPAATEAMAIDRIRRLARMAGAPLYVVHVSGAEALAAVAADPAVVAETCPQYLVLDDQVLEGDAVEAAKYVFTPPPRTPEDQDALWEAARSGVIRTIGSDHGGYRIADKLRPTTFDRIPQGLPGIETRLPLLHHFGVAAGRLSASRMVELIATEPARVFGLYPRKGAIGLGADADLTVFDPGGKTIVTAEAQHSATDYTPYEGLELRGAVETVLIRGATVVSHGETVALPGHGRFIARAREGLELPVTVDPIVA